jgi:hypothetical protein
MKFLNKFDLFLYFIIIIKIIFIVSTIGHIILTFADNTLLINKIDPKLIYWKQHSEFLFIVSMAVLLIYHFRPQNNIISINQETALLFYIFGWVLLITANWSLFIFESPWLKIDIY